MATLVYREGQNLNFAISAERIQSFLLNEANKPQAQTTPEPVPTTPGSQTENTAQANLVMRVNRALDNHDWRTLTEMTVSAWLITWAQACHEYLYCTRHAERLK